MWQLACPGHLRRPVRRAPAIALVVMGLSTACGADNQPTAMAAPGGGGSNPPGPTAGTRTDAGRASFDDDDGGVSLAGAALSCENVDEVPFTGEDAVPGMFLNATDTPDDFAVTRVSIGFEDDCEEPTVIMSMGGGRCPDGDGHELVIAIDGQTIEAGRLVGQYTLGGADGDAVRVRYHRPSGLDPAGLFGTCGSESGTIDFASSPGLSDGDRYEGSYDFALGPCDGGDDDEPQIVRGSFSLALPADLTCEE